MSEPKKPKKDPQVDRLLLKDCDHGYRGKIVTLSKSQADALPKGTARKPTPSELQLGKRS